MKHLSIVATLAVLVLLSASAHSAPRITIRVSPAVAMAPAVITIKTTIEPSDDNRALAIAIDSATYHRSTEIPLEGRSAPRVSILEIRDVPPGLHEVRAVLVGSTGRLANTMQLVKVEAGPGTR
jgi:hypothetical protein